MYKKQTPITRGVKGSLISRIFNKLLIPVYLIYQRHRVIIFHAAAAKGYSHAEDLSITRLIAIEKGSLPYLAMKQADYWDDADMTERRTRQDVCYTVTREGHCVHFSWLSTAILELGEVHFSMRLPAHHGWIYSCFTVASQRGRGIFPRILKHIIQKFYQSGGEHLWIGFEESNTSSLRAISKAGFKEVAWIERRVWFSMFSKTQITPLNLALFKKLSMMHKTKKSSSE